MGSAIARSFLQSCCLAYFGCCPGPLETPAARITLMTPAAKPSKRNTIIPHGEIPSHLSSAQPMNAPTRTPATSSVERRKPRARADGSLLELGPASTCRLGPFWWASRSPRCWSLAERAASSADRLLFPLSSPVSPAMCGGPQFDTGVASKPRYFLPSQKAARTIVLEGRSVKKPPHCETLLKALHFQPFPPGLLAAGTSAARGSLRLMA